MRFLMNAITSWNGLFGPGRPLGDPTTGNWGWVQTLTGILSTVLWVVLALVGAAGGIYAVYVGIKMARADSAEAREENKKRLINIVISIVVVIVLIIFFNVFLPMIIGAFADDQGNWKDITGDQAIATAARVFLRMPL